MHTITESELVEIGSIGKPHGVDGELNVRLTADVTSIEELFAGENPFIFVYLENLPIPMAIESWRTKGAEGILLQLKRIDDREKAGKLMGCPFAIEAKYLENIELFTPEHFIGFSIYNEKKQLIGQVVAVNDATANILFSVGTPDSKTFLLPVADELVQSVDALEKKIVIAIPEGIMEL